MAEKCVKRNIAKNPVSLLLKWPLCIHFSSSVISIELQKSIALIASVLFLAGRALEK